MEISFACRISGLASEKSMKRTVTEILDAIVSIAYRFLIVEENLVQYVLRSNMLMHEAVMNPELKFLKFVF